MQARAICCSRPSARNFLPTDGLRSLRRFSGLGSRRRNFWLPPNGGQKSEVRWGKQKDRRFTQVSNTASNLSGFASLRETSAIQSRKEFLTLRRKDAKKKDTSNGRISISNLSGLAPLRDTSSKHQSFFGHAIGDALNAVLDHVLAEINKEAESLIHQPQIGQDLFAVDRIERSDRFQLHDHEIIDDQIGAEAFVEGDSIPCDRNNYLSFHGVAVFAQFMRKQDFVYDFEDAWPEPSVQAVGSVNNQSRDFILFHRAKLVLLLPACEAKNFSALAFLRGTSTTQSQEDSFTLRRKGAKEAPESKHRISSRNLSGFASLRETSATQFRKEVFTLRRE